MAEAENYLPASSGEEPEITHLDGRPESGEQLSRRSLFKRAVKGAGAVAAGFAGVGAITNPIEAKNQADTKAQAELQKEHQIEVETANQLNAYKLDMYGKVLSKYLNVLGFPDGHSGSMSRLIGFLSNAENTADLTKAMQNGNYEPRTAAFLRMKQAAEPFLDTHFEQIQRGKAPDGFTGEPYPGTKQEFVSVASDLIAYATSRGAQPKIGKNLAFPTQAFVEDSLLDDVDDILAVASRTKTAEVYTPDGPQSVDPRQYFLKTLSEASANIQASATQSPPLE